VATLARAVAERWAGTLTDVLRLAVPPRRAAAEKRPAAESPAPPAPPAADGFARYPTGAELLTAIADGRPVHAVWTAIPGEDWPVADLGLVAIWDDGDDLHAEPRAPYANARDVLVHRSYLAGCAAIVAATARTAEAALLVESGWAQELTADRAALRAATPRVQ